MSSSVAVLYGWDYKLPLERLWESHRLVNLQAFFEGVIRPQISSTTNELLLAEVFVGKAKE